jgi:hypothetical protein
MIVIILIVPTGDKTLPSSLPFIGMIGVDLSSKMLQKASNKECYGDLIVGKICLHIYIYKCIYANNDTYIYLNIYLYICYEYI